MLLSASITQADTKSDSTSLYKEASAEMDAGRFNSAIRLYLAADSAFVAEGKGKTDEYAAALHNTGRAYLNDNQLEKGRAYTHQAMELREKLHGKVSKDYITSLNNYALSYLIENKPEEGIIYQTEVIDLCSKMNPPHPDEGMYLINLARMYHALNDDANASKYMEMALPKVEKFSTNYEYALNFLGMVYMENNDNANTNRIMGLMDEHNRHELTKECNTPECHLDRAEYYTSAGESAKAKEEFMTVFGMDLTDAQKAAAYRKYAQFLTSQNDYAQAADYYHMASDILKNLEGVSETTVGLMRQAGLCYFIGKEYDKSIEAHKRVIKEVDSNNLPVKLKASSLEGLGNSYSAKKGYNEAIISYKAWRDYLKSVGEENSADYAKAYERIASAEKYNSEYEASEADYNEAIRLYEALRLHDKAEEARNGLKMCLFYAGQTGDETSSSDKAKTQRENKLREIIDSSINTLQQGGDYLGALSNARTYATIAGCYAQLEDYTNALDYYTKYINTIRPALSEDFLYKNPKERELTWRQELLNLSEMNALIGSLPENDIMLYTRLSTLIYEGLLLSKGILLSSEIEFEKILSKYGNKEMLGQYQEIKNNLVKIEKLRKEHKSVEELAELTRKTDALQLALSKEAATKGLYTDFLKYTAADVVSALNPDEAAVEFVTLNSGVLPDDDIIAAVVITKDFPTGITIPIGNVGQIKSIMADAKKFENDNYTATIWGNIMSVTQGKRKIYFSPDGLLNNIGIEYLTLQGQPISDLVEMSRLSSTREICRVNEPESIKFASLFGGIDYISEGKAASDKRKYAKHLNGNRDGKVSEDSDELTFIDLDHTGMEVSEIDKLLKSNLKGVKTFSYTGVKASKDEFLSQDQLPLNLIHLATHGMYLDNGKGNTDSGAMQRSMLAFAGASGENIENNKGLVTAAEIADMSLQDCELVVLSACESGLGKLGEDGVFGLQRGFKNAGVKSLLVSLNEVADKSTADMMIEFYTNFLSKGMTKSQALKEAGNHIRAQYPDDNTWASFILIDSFN